MITICLDSTSAYLNGYFITETRSTVKTSNKQTMQSEDNNYI